MYLNGLANNIVEMHNIINMHYYDRRVLLICTCRKAGLPSNGDMFTFQVWHRLASTGDSQCCHAPPEAF